MIINQLDMLMGRRRIFPALHGGGAGSILTHQGDPQGVTSLVAKGTATPTFSRSGTRRVRRYVSGAYGYYEVADGVVPVGINGNGDYVIDCNPSGVNYCLRSTDINNWSKSLCTTPSSVSGPLYGYQAYAFVESTDAGAESHYVDINNAAAGIDTTGKTCYSSVIIGRGSRVKFELRVRQGTSTMILGRVNTTTHAVTDSSAAVTATGYKPLLTFNGVEFFLYWFRFTGSSNGTAIRNYIFSADIDGNTAYQGVGATCFYVAYCGTEVNVSSYSSPIITTTATVARNADVFYYKGDDGNLGGVGGAKKGTLRIKVFQDAITLGAARMLFAINDGGSAADEILLTAAATTGYVSATITASGGTARTVTGPNINVLDGAAAGHVVQLSYQAGKAILWVDGTAGATNTDVVAADIPDDLDRMVYGYFPIDAGNEKFWTPPKWSYQA